MRKPVKARPKPVRKVVRRPVKARPKPVRKVVRKPVKVRPKPVRKVARKPVKARPKPVRKAVRRPVKARPKPVRKAVRKPVKARPKPVRKVVKKVARKKPRSKVATGRTVSATQKAFINKFKASVNRAINKNKKYPMSSRRRNHQGIVLIGFTLMKNGSIINTKVIRSSGYKKLDQAALKAVQGSSRKISIPKQLTRASWKLSIPIQFTLR